MESEVLAVSDDTQAAENQDSSGFAAVILVLLIASVVFASCRYNMEIPYVPISRMWIAQDGAKASPVEVPSVADPPPRQDEDLEKLPGSKAVWKFFRDNGLTREQTAGIMGNAQAESHFDFGVEEKLKPGETRTAKGFGVLQWTWGRRTALETTAQQQGKEVTSKRFQLEYAYREMHIRKPHLDKYSHFPNEWEMMRAQTTVEGAVLAFHEEFERSENSPAAVLRVRLPLALAFYGNSREYP